MKKAKSLLVFALVAAMILSLVACGKKEEKKPEYTGEVTEKVIQDVLTVKYPAEFKVNDQWSGENFVTLRKGDELWEVSIGISELELVGEKSFESLEETHKQFYSTFEKATLAGKDGFKVDAGAAITYYAKYNDEKYISFSCKVQFDKEADYKEAFETPEVQYILNNLSVK